MEKKDPPVKGVRSRYLTALIVIVLSFIGISFLDGLIRFAILNWYPQYTIYIIYVSESFNTLFAILVLYIVYRVLVSIIDKYRLHRVGAEDSEIGKTVLRILLYISVLTVALVEFGPALGVSFSQALAGGAVGGIIIGLAVQTIVSAILSGFLVASSKTISRGDIVVMHSNYFNDTLCRVIRISTLFTDVRTPNGNSVKIPNTILFSYTTFTHLRMGTSNVYAYPYQVTFSADVPLKNFTKRLEPMLKKEFEKLKIKPPDVYLGSKTSTTNTFNVIIYFDNFDLFNKLIDTVNVSFDDVYWSLKK